MFGPQASPANTDWAGSQLKGVKGHKRCSLSWERGGLDRSGGGAVKGLSFGRKNKLKQKRKREREKKVLPGSFSLRFASHF